MDIETLPLLVPAWNLGKNEINYTQILKEIEVDIIGYAWNDQSPKALVFDWNKYKLWERDDDADKGILVEFSKLIEKATVTVGHNSKLFDISKLRSRLVKYGLPDFSPTLIDDTYLQSKDIGFTSHKLDYLSVYLGEGQKEEHDFQMWIDVMYHKKGSLDKKVKYCLKDVDLLRRIYKRLKPYTKSSLNLSVFNQNTRICPNCGSEGTLIVRKNKYTNKGMYKQFQCNKCHHYCSLGTNQIQKSALYPR